MKVLWVFATVAIATISTLSFAQSAEFTLGGDAESNCLFTMSGEIVSGDANQFKSFVRSIGSPDYIPVIGQANNGEQRYMCLNSPGGDLLEAIEIIEYILQNDGALEEGNDPFWLRNLGTAVPRDASCASACAIMFFAGQQSEGDFGRYPDRTLHATARLGFHSPKASFSQQTYTSAEMEESFNFALEIVTRFFKLSPEMDLPLELIAQNFLTPFDDIFWLEYVNQVAEYNIKLIGLPPLENIGKNHIQMLCGTPPSNINRSGANDNDSIKRINPHSILWAEKAYFAKFERSENGITFEIMANDEGESNCQGKISNDGYGYYRLDNNADTGVYPWMLYPPISLPQLYKKVGNLSSVQGETELQTINGAITSHCYAVEDQQIIAQTKCRITAISTMNADLDETFITQLTWDQGTANIVINDSQLIMNGKPARLETNPPEELDDINNVCVNYGTGIFCYLLH